MTTTMAPRLRLLIVDDSPVALSFLQAVFKSVYDVETANDGEQGLAKALASAPDLIVTDSLMPKVDGFELIRRLKTHPSTVDTPVVMLTSSDISDEEYTSRTPRPDALVAKSMKIEPLLAEVKALLLARGDHGIVSS